MIHLIPQCFHHGSLNIVNVANLIRLPRGDETVGSPSCDMAVELAFRVDSDFLEGAGVFRACGVFLGAVEGGFFGGGDGGEEGGGGGSVVGGTGGCEDWLDDVAEEGTETERHCGGEVRLRYI